ncbi:MAG: acriflavine resistance protein B [Acidobacteria bacterium 37-71-11]|nr:MAG: acriflavine resistance protein B [Acidobacteria bacterium 37-71-11]HQT95040.1 efflux RND transporter permease subunit [Thermoanaerobaculaceae bacterium]
MDAKSAIRQTLERPVLWFLVYGALLAYGVVALIRIPTEVLPRFNYPQISITVHYPGATAEDMENLVARPLEGQLLSLPDLSSLRSVMGQNTLEIDARFRSGGDAQMDLQSAYGAIDRARASLPPGVQPYAQIMGAAINEVADYALEIPPDVSPALAQRAVITRIEPAVRAIAGVERVIVFGGGTEAIWVQPDLKALRQYGVPATALEAALKSKVLLGPAGYLRMGHEDVLVQARDLPATVASLDTVTVPSRSGAVPLRALANIVTAAEPTRNAEELDGRQTVAMLIFKHPGASTVPVTRAVERTLESLKEQLPPGARWVRVYSQGHLVGLIGHDLGRNLVIGGLLAVLVLFWLLGLHRGVWILALSIPTALLMGIAGLHATGQSLNLLTLGALSVAVGLLADDGIIVLESISHRWETGDEGREGVWLGLCDIAAPDTTGTLSAVSVFLPLLLVGGIAGLFFIPFALAMSLSLLASLLISLTLIPLLLGLLPGRRSGKPAPGAGFIAWLERHNERLLNLTLRRPGWSLATAVALLLVSIAALFFVPVNFLPLPNEGVLLDSFTLPPGTGLDETKAAVSRITAKLLADPDVEHVLARIGSSAETSYTEPNYAGEIQITLKPGVKVQSLDRLAARLLHETRLDGVQQSIDTPTIERLGESLSGLPQPFAVTVYGEDLATLRNLSQEVTARLRRMPALTDLFNNDAYPVSQLQIQPDPAALATYGLTPAGLYAQIQPLLGGTVVARIPQGNYHLDLYLRLADSPGLGMEGLQQLLLRTQKGWTPLGQLASVKLMQGPNAIRHIDGARAVQILGTPTGPLGNTISKAKRALQGLAIPPGYRVDFGGLLLQLEDAAIGLGIALLGALLLLFGILLLQFDGLLLPSILLLEMPLAFTGGALALAVSGKGLNATGLVGLLTLVGMSLNHDIVLLHRARRNEALGMEPEAAVREAVRVRFRPILLTTLTAALGVLPTAMGWGLGAEPEQGLALVILGGTLWSSLLSTNLIPALYLRWAHNEPAEAPPPLEHT